MAEPLTTNTPITPSPRRAQPQKRIPTTVMIFAFIFVAGIGYVAGGINSGLLSGNINTLLGKGDIDLSSVQETYQALESNFDGDLDKQKLIEGANKGLVDAAGDQYTIYMNKKESTSFDDALSGNIGGGIGVEVGIRSNVPTVVRVLQDNPAEKSGVMINDSITKVNGESTEGKTLTEVTTAIRGEVGTTVKLTVLRNGE